jgi:hypothetical protein
VVKILYILLVFLALPLSAQTGRNGSVPTQAEELDALLAAKSVTYGQAARFILDAADLLPEGSADAEERAFAIAKERGWVPDNAGAHTPIRLSGAALMVMGSFNIKGGLMYRAFKNPRYAYRELVYLKVIQGRTEPGFTVSGERLMAVIGRALDHTGRGE